MAGGLTNFLFSGQPPPIAPTGSDTSTAFPAWLTSYLANTMGGAYQLAQQPFNPFPGPTLAAPSDPTKAAWALAQKNVGQFNPTLSQGAGDVAAGAAPVNPGDISKFLNPYENYVTGALNRNLMNNVLPAVQDKFVSAGQSRSPQEAELTRNAVYDTQQAAGQALANNYGGALGALMSQRQQQIGGGETLGRVGALGQQMGAADVGALAATGQSQDIVNQANINAARDRFQQEQQWPYQQVGFLSDIIRGLPVQAAGSTQQNVGATYLPAYNPSPFSSFLGALSVNKGLGMRRGGAVPRFDPRGGALSRSFALAA